MTIYNRPDDVPAFAESGDRVQPSNAEIQTGWPLSPVPPSRQRFNWILNYVANAVRYFMQRGISEWNALEDYPQYARVQQDGLTYIAKVANSGVQPSTNPAQWERWGFSASEIVSILAPITPDDANSRVGINNGTPAVTLDIVATDAIKIPTGTTAQRPTGANGYIRHNSTLNIIEAWISSAWTQIGGVIADASTTVKGIVELATNTETTAGTDTARAVTPAGLKARFDALFAAANIFTSNQSIDVNTATPALRVTQSGSGEVVRFEDTTNPDGSPTIIDQHGNCVIGGESALAKLHVFGQTELGSIYLEDSTFTNASPAFKTVGKRSDGNTSPSFGGKLALAKNRTDAPLQVNNVMGTVYFGGNHTDGDINRILYSASIAGVSEGTFSDAITMPTGIAFYTGSNGITLDAANVYAGIERMRIDSFGNIVKNVNASVAALTVNNQTVDELTSNTKITTKVRGTDGTTRSIAKTNLIEAADDPAFSNNSERTASTSWVQGLVATVGIGVDQTRTIFTSPARQFATNYTNLTGRPIEVSVTCQSNSGTNDFYEFLIDGVVQAKTYTPGVVGATAQMTMIVQAGEVYRVNLISGGGIMGVWSELTT